MRPRQKRRQKRLPTLQQASAFNCKVALQSSQARMRRKRFTQGSQSSDMPCPLKPTCLLLFFLLADHAALVSPSACDFSLPPLTLQTSISKSIHYPPLPLSSAASRYSWTCNASKHLRISAPFNVHARASLPVSGMLALAAENRSVFSVQVIIGDPFSADSDAEWHTEAVAHLSHSFQNAPSALLPSLQLKFTSRACGCIKRLRFDWGDRIGAYTDSCEALVSLQSSEHGNAAGACFPLWAYQSSSDASAEHSPADHVLPPHVGSPSTSCLPVLWHTVPFPRSALRTVSFDGRCRFCCAA